MAFSVTTGVEFVADLIRYRISDLKTITNQVVQEDVGASVGSNPETFYTDNLPITSGFGTHLRIGRWLYTEVETAAAAAGIRGYLFSTVSGSFYIPAGATTATSGDRVKVSYSWDEEQPYQFKDSEIYLYIGDAITTINSQLYNFGHTFSVSNGGYFISPNINESSPSAYIYAMYASYLIKKQLESEGFGDRIYVRDINITIDTSKGLNELTKTSKELYANVMDLIHACRLKGQEEVFTRIDTYSTYPIDGNYMYDKNYHPDEEFF